MRGKPSAGARRSQVSGAIGIGAAIGIILAHFCWKRNPEAQFEQARRQGASLLARSRCFFFSPQELVQSRSIFPGLEHGLRQVRMQRGR